MYSLVTPVLVSLVRDDLSSSISCLAWVITVLTGYRKLRGNLGVLFCLYRAFFIKNCKNIGRIVIGIPKSKVDYNLGPKYINFHISEPDSDYQFIY